MAEHFDPIDQATRIADAFAVRVVSVADIEANSIEWWMQEAMRTTGQAEAKEIAREAGVAEGDARHIVAHALRRRYLARRVAALPAALREIFRRCGDPTVPTLLYLAQRVPQEERGGMDAIRAVRRLYVCTEAQARVTMDRIAMRDRLRSRAA